MKALIVSGIWPPDVGGPASHAPEVASFLLAHGHGVEVVTTADAPPAGEEYPVHWVRRSLPPGVRHAEGIRLVQRRARGADVVYTTGMFGRSSAGALLARTPFVLKLTADPAYERARRWGLWRGSLEGFQSDAPPATLPLRLARDLDVQRAAHLITPSSYLRELALGWGVRPERVTVLPNPAPHVPGLRPREALRDELGFDGPTLAFAGRLTAQKSLGVGIEAARRAGVALVIAGDGPDRAALEAARARTVPRPAAAHSACWSSSVRPTRRSSPRRGRTFPTRRRGSGGRDAGDRDAHRRRRRGRARR